MALIAFGISEIEEREDAIQTVADDFMNRAIDDGSPDATNLMDGGAGCLTPADFTAALDNEIVAADEWSSDDISFVDRTGNGYLSNTSDPESFVYGGREDDGFAIVTGRLLLDGVTEQDLQVLLLKPGDDWRVCTLELL